MWLKDEKMIRNLKIACWLLWTTAVVITAVLFLAVQGETNAWNRFLPFAILIPEFIVSITTTLQYKHYSEGLFLSDYEIILPGVRQHRIDVAKLKKLTVVDQRTRSGKQFLLKFYVEERFFPYSVAFSSDHVRQEVLTTIRAFLKELTVEDKTQSKKLTKADHST